MSEETREEEVIAALIEIAEELRELQRSKQSVHVARCIAIAERVLRSTDVGQFTGSLYGGP